MNDEAMLPASGGVVPALDVDSVDDLKRLVAATTGVDGIVAYKLGIAGALRLGLGDAVRLVRAISDLPILYDHQKAGPDVPSMARTFCEICRVAGIKGLILFPLSGEKGVLEFVDRSIEAGLVPIVGGELPYPEYCSSGGGYVADDALERIIQVALRRGVKDFVLPANDAELLRLRCASLTRQVADPGVFLPGIGPLGGNITDAVAATIGCRRYVVVGRAIAAAKDPAEAARRLCGEFHSATTLSN